MSLLSKKIRTENIVNITYRFNLFQNFVVVAAALVVFTVGSCQASSSESDASEESVKERIIDALLSNPSNKAAHFLLDHIDYKTTKYIYDVYEECFSGCWKNVLNEKDLNKCVSSKKTKCKKIQGQRAKDLLIYYATLYAEGKAMKTTKSILHIKPKEKVEVDDDQTLKEKAVSTGFKIAKSAAKSKATSMAVGASVKAVKNALFN